MKQTIVEYLEFSPSKSCTFIALCILCDHFKVPAGQLTDILNELYNEGTINLIEHRDIMNITIVLVPNLSISK